MLLFRSSLAPVIRSAAALLLGMSISACTGEAGNLVQMADAGEVRGVVKPAGSRAPGIVNSTPRGTLDSRDLAQRVLVRPRPPKIIAQDFGELPEALTYAARSATGDAERVRGARWTEAAQIGLLFGSPEGKAYLAGKQGRALVRGEPMESCPILDVALAPTDDQATEGAMRACLNEAAAMADCGCRLIARGDYMLAKRDEFAYAIGVGTTVIDQTDGSTMTYASEERIVEGRPGSRHVWLLGVNGPVGLLQVEPDGRAAMTVNATGRKYTGLHKADGFRRGRIARRAYLTGENGRNLVVLVGYEDTEFKDNRTQLTAWNPYGSPVLKKAEAK